MQKPETELIRLTERRGEPGSEPEYRSEKANEYSGNKSKDPSLLNKAFIVETLAGTCRGLSLRSALEVSLLPPCGA